MTHVPVCARLALALVALSSSACADLQLPGEEGVYPASEAGADGNTGKSAKASEKGSERSEMAGEPPTEVANACKGYREPPPLFLTSESARQLGGQGGFCSACGGCSDRPSSFDSYTVVRPGDRVQLSMPEGKLVPPEGCEGACSPIVTIRAECHSYAEDKAINEDSDLALNLSAGRYQLTLYSNFVADSGDRGNTSATFGLIVDPALDRGILSRDSVVSDQPCGNVEDNDRDAG